jgi:putative oxygen-independent coproporphyrinogen III oxidase
MSIGIYISVPFCRSKCSFCNFASGVFSREKMSFYADRVGSDIASARASAKQMDAILDRSADTIYLGGGTPSTLPREQLTRIFAAVREHFDLAPPSEVTVECAPATLTDEMIETLAICGVNRVSLGVQSFIDREAASVGRLHTRAQALDDIARLRAAGIHNINLDLIAGLPYQTRTSWRQSLEDIVATGVPHVSVYILEVDEDSRLGRELIAGGTRYHAHHVPDADLAADLYLEAIEFLENNGIEQYEISNFARPDYQSLHNLKYWTRQPYVGFGVDAHSMLWMNPERESVAARFATTDDLERYLANSYAPEVTAVSRRNALEEAMFLGLRVNAGVDLDRIAERCRLDPRSCFADQIEELMRDGLLEARGSNLRLTSRGRLLSNEVFERFILSETPLHSAKVSS